MKIFFNLTLLCLFCWGTAVAQSADPSISGANFADNSIKTGETTTLGFSFVNTGFTEIPANSIEVTIVMANAFYTSDGSTAPSGPGSALFDWAYLGSDIWRGKNNTTIDAFGGGDISLIVTGIQESAGFETTNINVQPVANFSAFANESSNDNQQPALKIDQGTGPAPCASAGGVGAACTDEYGNASTIGSDCNCIDLGPCYADGGVGAACTDVNGQPSTIDANCHCTEVVPTCTVGDACTDADGDASVLGADCNCIEVDNGIGTDADPAVTGANFVPNQIEEGATSTLTISFANSGSTAIPANSIDLTISMANTFYSSDGTTAPAGAASALFSWNYLGADTWRGRNIGIIPAFGGGDITLAVMGIKASSGFETTNINVQPVNQFGAFNNVSSNDNLQPGLKVIPVTVICAVTGSVTNLVPEACTTFGSAILVGSGGTAPYTFSGDLTAGADGSVSNLSAGNYQIVATDADGCASTPFNLVIANDCGCTDKDKDGVCAQDDCDDNNPNIRYGIGSACDDGNDCTENDVYDANCNCVGTPVDSDNDGVLDCDDVCPGFDDKADADGDGTPDGCEQCDGTLSIVRKELRNVSCYDGTDGKLVIEIQGGDGPYKTTWSNGPNTLFNSNIVAGSYTVTVEDINKCTATATYTIAQPTELVVSLVSITAENCDANTGAIDIEVTGGTAPYTYNWIAYATTQDLSGLSARDYMLEVTDANGCRSDRMTYTVAKDCGCDNVTYGGKVGFGSNCNLVPTICAGDANPLIGSCALPTGGSGTLQYVWLMSTTCPNRPPFNINNDPDWSVVQGATGSTLQLANLTETTCFIRCARRSGCDEYIGESNIVKVNVDNNAQTWYADKDGDGFGDPNDTRLACTQPNGYVSNADDCDDDNASIPALVGSTCDDGDANTDHDQIQADGCTCKGEPIAPACPTAAIVTSDGKVTISGLTAPRNYVGIFKGAQNQLVNSCSNCDEMVMFDLPAGNYRVLVQYRDQNNYSIPGCGNVLQAIKITTACTDKDKDGICAADDCDDDDPNVGAKQPVGSTCNDGNPATGNDVILADGCGCAGTPIPCYALGGDNDGDGVCADNDCDDNDPNVGAKQPVGSTCNDGNENTTDDKILADGCSCQGSPIPTCDLMVEELNITNPTCADRNDGVVAIVAANGVGPYKYEWSNGRTETNGIAGLLAGDYTVSITDANGCTLEKTYSLANPAPIMAVETIVDATCGAANGAIALVVSGGAGDYKYFWNGVESTKDQSNLAAGTYTLRIRDRNYCESEFTFTVGDIVTDACNSSDDEVVSCGKATITYGGGKLKIEVDPSDKNYRFVIHTLPTYAVLNDKSCDYSCGAMHLVNLAEGDYLVRVYENNEWRNPFCETFITMGGDTGCTDQDNDGVCAADDCDDNNPNIRGKQAPGTSCDDGNPNTENDRIAADGCGCFGTPIITDPCVANGGDKDGDGICADEDCDDNDPNLPAAQGTACNDGDATTENDQILADGCSCAGTPILVDPCLAKGGDADGDGVCAADDCDDNNPNYPKPVGTRCDDGNANTENDQIQSNGCDCAGTPIVSGEPNCDNVTATAGDGTITVAGLTSPIEHVKVYSIGADNALTQVDRCVGDCGDTWVAEGLAAGNYLIHITLRDRNWGSLCADGAQDLPIYVTVESGASASSRNSESALSVEPTQLKVYPNPARDEAFIDLSDWMSQSVDLVIHNHFSQVVFEQHIEKVSGSPTKIDLTSFTNGLYYIQVKTKGQRPVTKKLLVTRLY